MSGQLCKHCRRISLSMLISGFEHPLDYDSMASSRSSCSLCTLFFSCYKDQMCVTHNSNKACDGKHTGRLRWATRMTTATSIRVGMVKLDAYHFGPFVDIWASQGMTQVRQFCEHVTDSLTNVEIRRCTILACSHSDHSSQPIRHGI